MKPANLDHYLASLEGLALSRHWLVGNREEADRRFEALRAIMEGKAGTGIEFQAPELKVIDGYKRWAATYDSMPNPLIALEEEPVRRLIDAYAPGRALDAACGSGRHTIYLAERGHEVTAVDISRDMLNRAASRVPHAELVEANLTELPLESTSIDVAVCALALGHFEELGPPLAELARVLRPGGHLIVSNFHPFMELLGNSALFLDAEGRPAFVESHAHLYSDYLLAFETAHLRVRKCLEPSFKPVHLPALTGLLPEQARPAVEAGILGLPGALIWELERRPS